MGLFFGKGDGGASDTLNQIPGAVGQYYDPYINAGKQAMGALGNQYSNLLGNYSGIQNQYNTLMNDPNQIMGQIGSGYQQSPGYQWQLDQGLYGINNAAAAGGMLGTPQHQQQAGQLATNLANQNYWDYMNPTLGLYQTGLRGNQGLYNQGLSGVEGINQMGYNASTGMGNILADTMMNQANLQYANAANRRSGIGGAIGNTVSTLTNPSAPFWY